MRDYYVYILASCRNGTLYVGVTNDLLRRLYEHRTGTIDGFTKRHTVTRLVWYEATPNIEAAIRREKQLKEWQRAWKVDLIEAGNPTWRDLYPDLLA
jgi:putative endonuclease